MKYKKYLLVIIVLLLSVNLFADDAFSGPEKGAGDTLKSPAEINDKGEAKSDVIKREYAVLGLSLAGPAGLNFIAGYYFKYFGFHISGMFYHPEMTGGQLNLLWKFYESRRFIHSVSVVGGITHFDSTSVGLDIVDWKYGGIAYNFYWSGFFAELSITMGDGNYTNPHVMFQLGYIQKLDL